MRPELRTIWPLTILEASVRDSIIPEKREEVQAAKVPPEHDIWARRSIYLYTARATAAVAITGGRVR